METINTLQPEIAQEADPIIETPVEVIQEEERPINGAAEDQ